MRRKRTELKKKERISDKRGREKKWREQYKRIFEKKKNWSSLKMKWMRLI